MKQKILQITRHAKSNWDYDHIADIDRPLKQKGIVRAYQVSHKIKKENIIPDLMISSPATRALHTAVIFARVLGVPLSKLSVNQLLYDTSAAQIMELIAHTSDEVQTLMIFGHNPDFTQLVNQFARTRFANLTTGTSVSFVFKTDSWSSISKDRVDRQINHLPDKNSKNGKIIMPH
jgi:phosphohistidine phosphatase